ncbi:MAG TPA: hypothetical protein VNN25_22795 [Thermoanaerobaculia bacterium]|nr:hypothetical protein [Thermoanaerobaculia bacterium]
MAPTTRSVAPTSDCVTRTLSSVPVTVSAKRRISVPFASTQMNVTRTASAAFTAEFESEEELREEHRTNLSMGGLRLVTAETVALNATLLVTLRGPWAGESFARATVVALLPDGIALSIDGNSDELLSRLMAKPLGDPEPPTEEAPEQEETTEKRENVWDRIRGLSQMEKLLLAVKADRSERALLLQDNDPRVLLSLLRNPRLTVDEVARLAKSTFLNYQIADVIMKTTQWMSVLDVRLGLMHNAKTPPAFALRILPTLPESEIRSIARAGSSMALKTAALRLLQGR